MHCRLKETHISRQDGLFLVTSKEHKSRETRGEITTSKEKQI